MNGKKSAASINVSAARSDVHFECVTHSLIYLHGRRLFTCGIA